MQVYYGMLAASILMFAFQFVFNQRFTKRCGDTLQAALIFSGGSAAAGLVILLIVNRFQLDFSWFALFMSILTALNGVGFTFCSIKALGRINVSLFSMFAMLGGMVLPALVGILFFDEAITSGLLICTVLIVISLSMSVKKDSKQTTGYRDLIWYLGVFVLNGMSGVLSKIYQEAAVGYKPNEAAYSILCSIVTAVLSFLPLLFIKGEKLKLTLPSLVDLLCHGTLCRFANYLLLLTLVAIPASVQYSLVTGGVIVASTLISTFSKEKPSKREYIAVGIAVVGIIILML